MRHSINVERGCAGRFAATAKPLESSAKKRRRECSLSSPFSGMDLKRYRLGVWLLGVAAVGGYTWLAALFTALARAFTSFHRLVYDPTATVAAQGASIPIGQNAGFAILAVSAIALTFGCAAIAPARRIRLPRWLVPTIIVGDALAVVVIGVVIAVIVLTAAIPSSPRSLIPVTIVSFGLIVVGVVLLARYLGLRLSSNF